MPVQSNEWLYASPKSRTTMTQPRLRSGHGVFSLSIIAGWLSSDSPPRFPTLPVSPTWPACGSRSCWGICAPAQRAEAGPRSSRKAPAPMCPHAEEEEEEEDSTRVGWRWERSTKIKNMMSGVVLWFYGAVQHLESPCKVNTLTARPKYLYTKPTAVLARY